MSICNRYYSVGLAGFTSVRSFGSYVDDELISTLQAFVIMQLINLFLAHIVRRYAKELETTEDVVSLEEKV